MKPWGQRGFIHTVSLWWEPAPAGRKMTPFCLCSHIYLKETHTAISSDLSSFYLPSEENGYLHREQWIAAQLPGCSLPPLPGCVVLSDVFVAAQRKDTFTWFIHINRFDLFCEQVERGDERVCCCCVCCCLPLNGPVAVWHKRFLLRDGGLDMEQNQEVKIHVGSCFSQRWLLSFQVLIFLISLVLISE